MKLKTTLFACLFLVCGIGGVHAQDTRYDVAAPIGDTGGTRPITEELQALIDRCGDEGGGRVYFPAGAYLTGTITLRDNTFLELSVGATLLGSTDIGDYPAEGKNRKALIHADGVDNAGILGEGTINGQGDSFWRGKPRPWSRPDRLILFENSTRTRIDGVRITNSPNWTIETRLCDGVWINGVSIVNERKAPNTDGIDPVSSRNVFISNCYIDTGDDAICPKSIGDVPTENLVVTNCVLISDDAGIKLGTRSEAPIRDAVFSNIVIKNTRYGIAFFAKDGGAFENIRFQNIHIQSSTGDGVPRDRPMGAYPIFLDIERRDGNLGSVRGVFFDDITIDTLDGHCVFLGQPDSPLREIHLRNIDFTLHERRSYEGNRKPRGVRNIRDQAPNDFSDAPSHFTFAHVDGLSVSDLNVHDLSDDTDHERQLVWGHDVKNARISGVRNDQVVPNRELPLLSFRDSSEIEIASCSPAASAGPFVFLGGESTAGVVLLNNNLSRVGAAAAHGGGFGPEELVLFNNLQKP